MASSVLSTAGSSAAAFWSGKTGSGSVVEEAGTDDAAPSSASRVGAKKHDHHGECNVREAGWGAAPAARRSPQPPAYKAIQHHTYYLLRRLAR